jgi:tetratricopeptide (TPR) repeat protein
MLEVAADHGRRVLELARDLGMEETRVRGIASLADILLEGHQQQAHQLLDDALSEPGMTPDAPGYVAIAATLAKTEMRMNNDARAVELADEALRIAGGSDDEATTLDLLTTRAVALTNMGRTTEAAAILSGVLERARRRGYPRVAGRAAINLSYSLSPDDPATSFAIASEALEEAKRDGEIIGVRYLIGNAGGAAFSIGEWDWALEQTRDLEGLLVEPAEILWAEQIRGSIGAYRGDDVEEQAHRFYEESRTVDDAQYRATGADVITAVRVLQERYDEAMRFADEMIAEGLAGLNGAIYGGLAAQLTGDLPAARRYRDAFAAAPPGRVTSAHRATLQAGVATLEGRLEDARALYMRARDLAREAGAQLELANIGYVMALVPGLEPVDRAPAAAEAREIFERLGATPLVERIDAALAAQPGAPRASAQRRSEAVRELAGEG